MNNEEINPSGESLIDNAFPCIDSTSHMTDSDVSGIDLQPILARVGVCGRWDERVNIVDDGGEG
jgi:hypothetical protein